MPQCNTCSSYQTPIPIRIPKLSASLTVMLLCPNCCHAEPNGNLSGELYDEADLAVWRHNQALENGNMAGAGDVWGA